MTMDRYKLVVKGEILAGFDAEEVKANIADLFKLTDKPEPLARLFSGQAVTVKRGLDEVQARHYAEAIHKAGLGCEIVAEAPELESAPVEAEPVASEAQPSRDDDASSAWTDNPCHPPQADQNVPRQVEDLALVAPRKRNAGAGLDWFKKGFAYFKMEPWTWIGSVLIFWILFMGVSMIPFISVLSTLLWPVFSAGFMLACYALYRGETFGVGVLFAGFSRNLGSLIAVGALYFLGTLVIMVVTVVGMILAGGGPGGGPENPLLAALVGLVMFGSMVPLMMAVWFAPPLVVFHGLRAPRAMSLSFQGCWRNMIPFLVYGLVGLVLAIAATLPLMLGWLVLGPVIFSSTFAAYLDIFTEAEAGVVELE